jgi:Family of unknown function (DUF1028)
MKLSPRLFRPLRIVGLVSCFSLLVAQEASATWSIVAVNTKTGEVCIASATCLEDLVLQGLTPVIRVGIGAAACQSLGDSTGVNRMKLFNYLEEGLTPQQMLDRVLAHDNQAQNRQYGIVTLSDFPVSFTGTLCGEAKYSIAGEVDDIRYAIQGNVLTGVIVCYNAEQALINTPGDMGTRVMAAMEAARVMGGDGRCSCDINVPFHCGAPPPHFVYSAYTTYFIVSRMGDIDGDCNQTDGCANGRYYCDLQVVSDAEGPEPVLTLETNYRAWRAARRGLADHILSTVTAGAQSMPADGISRTPVDVQLRDIDGNIVTEPAILSVTRDYDGPPVARIGLVTDRGGGHYTFIMSSNTVTGQGKWKIEAQQSNGIVRLWPDLFIHIDPVTELHSGFDQLSATAGASVPLVLNSDPSDAGAPYIVLGSTAGTSPGQMFDGLALPLNNDAFFQATLRYASTSHFPNTAGALDAGGHAQGAFVAPPMLLANYIGRHFDWCGVVMGGSPHVTNLAGFDVVP